MGVLTVKELGVSYDKVEALKGINFTVSANEFIGIIGPNGGGKSTLVKAILGIKDYQTGDITMEEGQVLGYVPQHTTFDRKFPITVEEVILTGHLPKKIRLGYKLNHHNDHAGRVMKSLGIVELRKRQIGQLSGGQLQRVLLARALMNHPTILVLDEPTAGVDEASKEVIFEMLHEMSQYMTILMISHDSSQLNRYVDRLFYINKTIHIHDVDEVGQVSNGDNCPIDWYIEGEKLQVQLEEKVQ